MRRVQEGLAVLYADYERTLHAWQTQGDADVGDPVLIAVVNNKRNAQALFRVIGGGRDDPKNMDEALKRSRYPLWSNVPRDGAQDDDCGPPRTILVHSSSANATTAEGDSFRQGSLGIRPVGAQASGATKDELEDVLRTVGQPGKPGASVRCVVSVQMLTEGWDCQRVTHIMGYRKFDSQLLCEQTVGRALRRRDYDNLVDMQDRDTHDTSRRYPAEYATVLGVPFARLRRAVAPPDPPEPPPPQTLVRPMPSRAKQCRIWVPDFIGYAIHNAGAQVRLDPDRIKPYALRLAQEGQSGELEWLEVKGLVGARKRIKAKALDETCAGVWRLAEALTRMLSSEDSPAATGAEAQPQRNSVLFASCKLAADAWLRHESVTVDAPDKLSGDAIQHVAVSLFEALSTEDGQSIGRTGVPYAQGGRDAMRCAGQWTPFTTSLKVIAKARKSELNVSACHSELERRIALALEELDVVAAYVRNHGPDRIEVPYGRDGGWANYVPDFFVRGHLDEAGFTPHLVLEGKGVPDALSDLKKAWTRNWWVPCATAEGVERKQKWAWVEIGPQDDIAQAVNTGFQEASSA